jgi:hypothetical protein
VEYANRSNSRRTRPIVCVDYAEACEETGSKKDRAATANRLEPDRGIFGRADVRGPEMGIGRNAGASPRPPRRDHIRRTQRLAWERVRQAATCCNRGHRFNRRIEARTLVCPSPETVATESKVITRAVERERRDGSLGSTLGSVIARHLEELTKISSTPKRQKLRTRGFHSQSISPAPPSFAGPRLHDCPACSKFGLTSYSRR